MGLFANSTKVRHKALARAAGVTTTYIRGTRPIENLTAIPAKIRDDDFGGDVMQLTARERDWIYWADDLVLEGVPLTPQRNDVVLWTDDRGTVHRYEVLPRLGERCYRFTDQTQQQVRVFTVEAAA